MVVAHHVADDLRALAVLGVRREILLPHRVEDAALHRLQAVAHVRERARGDDRQCVIEVAGLRRLVQRHGFGSAGTAASKERPHPGAQLRITDTDGHRVTAFATNTARGQLADLELRHRRRARAEDRIRCAKDTGLTNLPLHDFDQNRIWCALVALACELTAWLQTLALAGHQARRWEPKRLRLRLFSAAGRLAVSGRRVVLHLSRTNHWGGLLVAMLARLRALAAPGG